MNVFRKWMSVLVVMALVVSAIPMAAHASVSHASVKKINVSQPALEHHNCDHAHKGETAKKAAKTGKHCGDHGCCEKNCECVGGICGGSLSVLGDAKLNIQTSSSVVKYFGLSHHITTDDHDGRLKRPPRA